MLGQIVEVEFQLLTAVCQQVLHESAAHLLLLRWHHQHIEIVAQLEVPEQLEAWWCLRPVAAHQRGETLERSIVGAYCEQVQLAGRAKMAPPGVLPLRGKKHTLKR